MLVLSLRTRYCSKQLLIPALARNKLWLVVPDGKQQSKSMNDFEDFGSGVPLLYTVSRLFQNHMALLPVTERVEWNSVAVSRRSGLDP